VARLFEDFCLFEGRPPSGENMEAVEGIVKEPLKSGAVYIYQIKLKVMSEFLCLRASHPYCLKI
jgi:hypothetical protein